MRPHALRTARSGSSALQFAPREHVLDWHGAYPNPPRAAPTAGPAAGILKV
jgi:hypothetical protein